ncbi:MAG: tetratricopeptide repeat protein [Acidobacteria bacterium]|nr:MAG: tetratricopeptide repeat protein [Acidobacteriota bacterium]
MNRQARFRRTGIACALLVLGGCSGEPAGPRPAGVSDEIPRPADLDGVDPNVVRLIENGIRFIEDDPGAALPRAGLGMIYHANEMFVSSRIAYRQALAIEPDNARWLYHVARIEERLDDVDAAIATIGASIELEPGYAPSYWRRGGWRLNLDRPSEAEADFRKAIEIAPQDPAGHIGLARALIAQDRAEEAATLLETLLLDQPDDPLAHLLLGNAFRASGKTEQAEYHLGLGQGERVMREDAWIATDILPFKLSFGAQMQMAVTLASIGQPERAVTVFEQLLQREPTDARLLRHLGRTYMALGRSDEGLATLTQGIELHPRDPKLLGETATAYQRLGQSERALELLDLAVEIKPDDGLAHARRGVILQSFKRYPQAAESYRRALVYRPQDTLLMRRFGDCLIHMRQYEVAAAAYQRALTFDENDAELLSRLAFVLHRLGRFAGAEKVLGKAIELKPGNPEWAKLLEELRRAGQG